MKKTEKEDYLLMKRIQQLGLLVAAFIMVAMLIMPTGEILPLPARNMLGVLLIVIVLLVTEALPMVMTCLLSVPLLVIFGCVESVSAALSGYTNQIVFFIIASLGISKALTSVPLAQRILVTLMRLFGKDSKQLLFAIMLAVCIMSSIISNVAAAAVFLPVTLKFLDVYEDETARKSTAKCYMIALPVASMIGGMMTPAGSSINLLAIGILEKNTGFTVRFVEWMLFGIPMAVALLPIAWFICTKVFKPQPLEREKLQVYLDSVSFDSTLSKKEFYVLGVVGTMLVLWILSSWYPQINITVVGLIGLALFFIPGFEIMQWKEFERSINWSAFFLPASMISVGNAITSSGLSEWLAHTIFPASMEWPIFAVVGFVALLTFALLIPIPVAPALVTMLGIPLVKFAAIVGIDPMILMMTLGLAAGNCYLLPLDTVPIITYSTGAYRMFDMPKVTIWIQFAFLILAAIWIPIAGMALGVI